MRSNALKDTRSAVQGIGSSSFQRCALIDAIDTFTSDWNDHASPFVWVKTADQILAKAIRKTKDHSGAPH